MTDIAKEKTRQSKGSKETETPLSEAKRMNKSEETSENPAQKRKAEGKNKIPLPIACKKPGQKTYYPESKALYNLENDERILYDKMVQFKKTVENIEDDLAKGSTKMPKPDDVSAKFLKTKIGKEYENKKRRTWDCDRSTYKRRIRELVDKHNVANGHETECPPCQEIQTKLAQAVVDDISTDEEIDGEILARALRKQKLKMVGMTRTDLDEWPMDETEEEEEEEEEED